MPLAWLTLTTPLLLAGLSLLALPLIAHWLQRRSRRTLVFPSIALLVQTAAQQSHFQRLKRRLLLALRLLAVACIVLAFTRPVWQSTAAGSATDSEAAAAVVIVLDASASTGQTERGVAEWESLLAAAGEALDGLDPGVDLAGVVVADHAPHSVFPRLSANLDGLRGELARIAPTFSRADFPAAFSAAVQLLQSHDGPRRLEIVTDLQRSNWADLVSRESADGLVPPGTRVRIVGRGEPSASNIAVSRLRQFPPLPLAGEPCDVTAQLANHSGRSATVRVTCERTSGDGNETLFGRDEQTVTLAANERRDVTFRIPAAESERQLVRIEAAIDDALRADNVAWRVLEPSARTPVVVLTDDDVQAPGTAGYYLLRALAPTTDIPTRFAPQPVRPAELTDASISGAAAVVVGELPGLSGEQAQRLVEYVRQGGGLVLFCGDGPVDRNLQALETAAGSGEFLPWSLGVRRSSAAGSGRRLGSARWQSRWLRAFDEQSQLALQEIHFARSWSAGTLAPTAEILLTFDDGTPAVGTRALGRGIVVVCGFSPDATTGDLARHGAFVALTQLLTQGVIPADGAEAQPLVGAAWAWNSRVAAGEEARWTAQDPIGQPVLLTWRTAVDGSAPSLARTLRPGVYQLFRDDRVVEAVAIGLDEREADLDRIPAAELKLCFTAAGADVQATMTGAGLLPPLRGRPLWGELLLLALLLFAIELGLLGWWRR